MRRIASVAIAAALLAATTLAVAQETRGHYTAFFSWRRFGPDGADLIAGSPEQAVPVSLPYALSNWACVREAVVRDESAAYQRLICRNGTFAVSAIVDCDTTHQSGSSQNFSLAYVDPRTKTVTHVMFAGTCATVRNDDDLGF